MTEAPAEPVLTWICHPDDLAPGYLAKAEANMTPEYSAAVRHYDFSFRFVSANQLVPTIVDRPVVYAAAVTSGIGSV